MRIQINLNFKKTLASLVVVASFLFTGLASADLLCGEATFNCVHPTTGALLIINKKAMRFCTIDPDSTKDDLLAKLSFYERCAEIGGLVEVTDMNK